MKSFAKSNYARAENTRINILYLYSVCGILHISSIYLFIYFGVLEIHKSWFNFQWKQDSFLFPTTLSPITWVPTLIPPCRTDGATRFMLTMSKSEVRNEWSYPCTPFYVLMICTRHLHLIDVGFNISDHAASNKMFGN